jgi:hypothetical protein
MMEPVVGQPYQAGPRTHVIPTYWPIPGVGVIAMNAFAMTMTDPAALASALGEVERLEPAAVLSSHLPPIRHCLKQVTGTLRSAPAAPPVPGVTQAELETLLAQFAAKPAKETAHAR